MTGGVAVRPAGRGGPSPTCSGRRASPEVEVPNVVGQPITAARLALTRIGLRIKVRRVQADPPAVEGLVVDQDPRRGRRCAGIAGSRCSSRFRLTPQASPLPALPRGELSVGVLAPVPGRAGPVPGRGLLPRLVRRSLYEEGRHERQDHEDDAGEHYKSDRQGVAGGQTPAQLLLRAVRPHPHILSDRRVRGRAATRPPGECGPHHHPALARSQPLQTRYEVPDGVRSRSCCRSGSRNVHDLTSMRLASTRCSTSSSPTPVADTGCKISVATSIFGAGRRSSPTPR